MTKTYKQVWKELVNVTNTILNQIIKCISNQLVERIVQRIYDVKGFMVFADEIADVAGIEKLSLCTHYIFTDLKIHEDFLQFVPVFDVSIKVLAESVIENVVKFEKFISLEIIKYCYKL